jgi:hypothetical protein
VHCSPKTHEAKGSAASVRRAAPRKQGCGGGGCGKVGEGEKMPYGMHAKHMQGRAAGKAHAPVLQLLQQQAVRLGQGVAQGGA